MTKMTRRENGAGRKFLLAALCLALLSGLVMAVCPSGMVGYWKGEGNAADSAGTHSGSLGGDAAFTTGKVGQAFSFNGAGSVVIPRSTDFNLAQFTIEGWAYLDSPSGQTAFVSYGDWGTNLAQPGYETMGRWPGMSWNGVGGLGAWGFMKSFNFTQGKWHHIAFLFDTTTSTSVTLYVDGARIGSYNKDDCTPSCGAANCNLASQDGVCYYRNLAYTSSANMLLGNSGGSYNLKGSLDEVAFYNRLITPQEINAHYLNGLYGKSYCEQFTPPDADNDGVTDLLDNCVTASNSNQADGNGNGVGDACEPLLATVTPVSTMQSTVFKFNSTVKCQNAAGCGSLTVTLKLKDDLPLLKMYSMTSGDLPPIGNLGTDESSQISKVLNADDVLFSTSASSGNWETQTFVFTGANPNPDNITISWRGYQAIDMMMQAMEIRVYDYSTSSWLNLVELYANGPTSKKIVICSDGCPSISYPTYPQYWPIIPVAANPANFVGPNGQITVLARGYYYEMPEGSSCPFLYAWNGTGYDFIADINGPGGLGYGNSYTPGGIANPDPYKVPFGFKPVSEKDYIAIDNSQLKAVDGSYSVSIAEDANEVSYIDEAKLLVVDHAPGIEIFSPVFTGIDYWTNQPYDKYILHTVRNPQKPVAAYDENGNDILPIISEVDKEYTDWFGQLQWNTITVDLGDLSDAEQIKLLYNAYSDWAVSDDYSARYQYLKQNPNEPFYMVALPYIEVVGADGSWIYAPEPEQIGSAQGYPRTLLWDITDWFDANGRTNFTIRIHSFQRIPIDYIAVDTSVDEPLTITVLNPSSAELSYKGIPKLNGVDSSSGPEVPDYYSVTDSSAHVKGDFTRYGDVTPLLQSTDDKYIVMAPGDQAIVKFNEVPQKSGMERDYYLYSAGYFKGTNKTNNIGEEYIKPTPLPFVEMSKYPYNASIENYPYDAEHNAYIAEYNTRLVDTTSGHHTMHTDYVSVIENPPVSIPTTLTAFSTTSSNPQTSANVACLANMANGQSCTVSWNMKAIAILGNYKLFADYASTVLPMTSSATAIVQVAGGGGVPTETCDDLMQNQDETDVDCGGSVCAKCAVGQMCSINNDCQTNICQSGYCAVPPPELIYNSEGGTVADQGITVTVPSGALPTTELLVTIVPSTHSFAPVAGTTVIGQPLDIGPQCSEIADQVTCTSTNGCQWNGACSFIPFVSPVTITMPGDCSGTKKIYQQKIAKYIGTSWVPVVTCTPISRGGGFYSCTATDGRLATWNQTSCMMSAQTWTFSTYASIEELNNIFSIDDVSAIPGETISIPISLGNSVDIYAMQFIFLYPGLLQYQGITQTARTSGAIQAVNPDVSGVLRLAALYGIGSPPSTPLGSGNGGIYNVNFKVKLTAAPGEYPLSLTELKIGGIDTEPFTYTVINGMLTIRAGAPDTEAPVTTAAFSGTGNGEWFSSDVTVEIAATDNVAVDKIYYCLDTPSAPQDCGNTVNFESVESNYYTFTVPAAGNGGRSTLYYYSVDLAGNAELSVKSSLFGIDTAAPTTTDNIPPWWINYDLSITINASDSVPGMETSGANITYLCIDQLGQCNPSPEPATFIFADGVYYIRYYSVDNAGNVESVKTKAISIDGTAPETSATVTGNFNEQGWTRDSVDITLSGADETSGIYATYQCTSFYGNECPAYTQTDVPGQGHQLISGEGRFTYRFYSEDNGGRISPYSEGYGYSSYDAPNTGNAEMAAEIEVRIDASAPNTTMSSSCSQNSCTVTLTGVDPDLASGHDGSGISSIMYAANGGEWQEYSGQFTVTGEGRNYIWFYAIDNAGNQEEVQQGVAIIDTTAPLVDITVIGTEGKRGWYNSESVTVIVKATEPASDIDQLCTGVNGTSMECGKNACETG